jgi:electron transfer flavoprotein beta subunit
MSPASMPPDPTVDARPLIVACLRICDLRPEVDAITGSIRRDTWGIGLSAADGAALEHALRIAERWSARVVAVTVGPATVEPVLREVAALGAEVLRVPLPGAESDHPYERELGGDEQALARAIVAALRPWGPPSLVLCGDRSADRGTGALPAFVAHELGAAQALGLVSLEALPATDDAGAGGGRVLRAYRRLDGGWREQLTVALPAVCSVEGAGVHLRRASLTGALAAAGSAVPTDRWRPTAADGSDDERADVRVGGSRAFAPRTRLLPAPEGEDPRLRLLALTGALVAHDPPTVIGPVGAVEAADQLIAFLVRHGYLDDAPGVDGAGTGGDR